RSTRLDEPPTVSWMNFPCARDVSARKRSSASMAPAAHAAPGPNVSMAASASARPRRARPAKRWMFMEPKNARWRRRLTRAASIVVAGIARPEDIAVAVGRHRRDEAGPPHPLDQAGGPVVADAQVALHEGNRGAAALEHHRDRLVVHRVGLALDAGFAQRPGQSAETDRAARIRLLGHAAFEDAFDVVGLGHQLPALDDLVHFLVR